MCGIAGKLTSGEPVDRELLEAMCEALRHRGPDDLGIHLEGAVGIGMRRLAIIDVAGGNQPFQSEDGRAVAVVNGEIYNHRELRAELEARGHVFRSRSDAEVVVHLWEEHGRRLVERLHGMFALAVWDSRDRVLLLARDRFGKKPLHYRTAGGTLWFASEPRAILQDPAVPLEPDLRAIDAFLANGYVPHDRSAFAGLRKLPPASTLVWAPGGEPRVERYWEPALGPSIRVPLEEAAERVRDLVLEATRRRLESEVPLGAFLSGGLDSSAVVAAMARVSSAPVRTFSVAFTEGGFDESRHAEEVARRLGTIHERIEVGALDATLLPDLAWHMGEPFADPAALPTFQLAELTSRHVTVALSGDGGDELFSGYDRYRKLATSRRAELVSRPLRPLLARVGGAAPARELSRVARIARRLGSPPPVRYGEAMGFFDDRDRARLYGPAIRPLLLGDGRWEHLVRAWPTSRGSDWRVRAAHLDLESYLPDDLLAKVDLTSMAHSLEVRSPLLDQDLAAYAFRLPPSLNARGGGKQVLRRAVAGWLPDGIAGREKHGFLVPIDAWLRGQLRDGAHEALLDRSARERGLFDPAAVAGVLAAHDSGRDLGRVIWPMLCLEHWFRACVDAPVSREALGVGP